MCYCGDPKERQITKPPISRPVAQLAEHLTLNHGVVSSYLANI